MRRADIGGCRPSTLSMSLLLGLFLLHPARPAHADEYSLWNYFRSSAMQPNGMALARVENPYGAGRVNTVLYMAGTVQESQLIPVIDGPSSLEALVPGPSGERRHYGFRLVQGSQRDLLPVRLADGIGPLPGDLTKLADDPVGDEVFGRAHLDLVECRVSFTSTRLYAALRNNGGGFPVVQGLAFFGYLFALSDPSDDDPGTVWALLQTYTAPGVIGPGLYRIEGSGLSDMVQIGAITVQEFPAENTLLLSCLLDDLLSDPALAAWFDPQDPIAAVGAFTQRITLTGGPQEADRIGGGRLHMRELGRDPGPNTLPYLSGLSVSPPGPGAVAEVTYADVDGHCPVLSEIIVSASGGVIGSYPLYPQTLDYSGLVVYRTQPGVQPLVDGVWTTVEARFSDNWVDVVTLSLDVASTADEGRDSRSRPTLDAAPAPFGMETRLTYRLPAAGMVRLSVYDPAGREVAVLADGRLPAGLHDTSWDGRDTRGRRLASGVYLIRLATNEGTASRRITIAR